MSLIPIPAVLMTPSDPREIETIEQRLGQLSGQIQFGLDGINRRFDDLTKRVDRVSDLGERVAVVETTVQDIGEKANRTHDKQNQLMHDLATAGMKYSGAGSTGANDGKAPPDGNRRTVTVWDVMIFASGGALVYTVINVAKSLVSK